MKSLPFADFKTIFNKLFVFGKHRSFYDSVTTIGFIIKKRVADRLHVNSNLVRASRSRHGFKQCFIQRHVEGNLAGAGLEQEPGRRKGSSHERGKVWFSDL